ncbi:MAG: hypothetical protein ACYTHJ_04630 [Planctomycetota bacterium]|jgi:hypothetical protein
MQKSKPGRALFDKLSDTGGEISDYLQGDSRWTRGRSRKSGGDKPTARTGVGIEGSGLRLVSPRDRFDDGETWHCVDGGRLYLACSARTGAIILFVVVAVLAVIFMVGKASGQKAGFAAGYAEGRNNYADEAVSEIEMARAQAPTGGLVEDLLPQAPAHSVKAKVESPAVESPNWVRGYTYLVVQEFRPGRRDDARAALDYLGKKGIRTAVVTLPSGWMRLMTLQGYNHKVAAEKEKGQQLRARVHKAGKKYYDSGGQYKLQGYFKTLTGDSW